MMHPYATNLKERHTVLLFIAGVAFLGAWGLSQIIKRYGLELPFWLEVPSAVGLYGIGFELFKHKLWKLQVMRRPGWVKTPIIDGQWHGMVRTSFDQLTEQHAVTVVIRQNWTEMSIKLSSRYSQSRSLIGAITVDDADDVLTYEYLNEPLPGAVETMHTHRGTARLVIARNEEHLEGEYYSGRDRQNQGVLALHR